MQAVAARLIAFYLPQFHPIPANDMWWGPGFTEWINVAKARALFPGHYQPHVPGELGFYDLRLAESREAQAELAREATIEGFCYWHYWFEGRRLLERPFKEVLATGRPTLPFCLAWANESWSRRWLGEDRDILIKQTYSAVDDRRHARWLIEAFADGRYITVAGKPLFLVYRPADLPNPEATCSIFRDECVRAGLPEPYLVGINAHCPEIDCRDLGFDATLDFEPQLGALQGFMRDGLKIYDDVSARRAMAQRRKLKATHPSVFVGWDNTPRRGCDGIVIVGSSPSNFEAALCEVIEGMDEREHEHRLVFVNAWNEWAEGNHLEPDRRHGRRYLEAVKRANLCEYIGRFELEEAPSSTRVAASVRTSKAYTRLARGWHTSRHLLGLCRRS
jgi:lipopolysaccharide biosynthesis protein